ncbi:MAG: SDR family oxidoreductase [Planctomycetota bacterium]
MSESSDARAAVITGGSEGIGLETARMLVAKGWRVLIVGRTRSKLDAAMDELGEDARACQADVGSPDAPREIMQCVLGEFGRLDALINNAGYAPLTPLADTTMQEIDESFAVNAVGPAKLVLEAWPLLTESAQDGGGRVVSVSTMATRDPFAGFYAYGAAKGAIDVLTKSIAKEGKRQKVRAFAVAPGAVETGMLRANFDEKAVPPSAALDPGVVAEVIVACACGERDGDNGTSIEVTP